VLRLLPILVAVAIGYGAPSLVCAQENAPAEAGQSSPEQRVDKAIADYESLRKDRKKQPQRNKALLWLGEIDHERVSIYLEKELARAGDSSFAMVVLQAIAKVPRSRLIDDCWNVMRRESAPMGVRNAAAEAVAKAGDRGIDKLIDLVRSGDDMVTDATRDAAIAALIGSGGDRAHRGLAPVLLAGSQEDRLKMLGRMDGVQGVPPVSLSRIRLVTDGDAAVSAMAWRQLAVEGHARAKELAIDVLERLPEKPSPIIAADVILGLCIVQDADLYPVVLRLGASTAAPVRNALRRGAEFAAKDPALVQFLATKGLEDARPEVRDAALLLLRAAPKEAVQPLLAKVRAALKNPKRKSLDLAIGLHDLLAKDPSWRGDLQALAVSRDAEVRTVGLSLLLELGADSALVQAQQSLGDKSWELRSIAYRYLARFRDTGSIPLLIARVDREEGRLAAELAQTLFVHTGTRCWKRKDWESWWAEHRTGFTLPHPDTVRGGSGAGGGGGTAVSYYDIPLVSSHVAFLIDRSGSMRAPIGTDRKFTRLDAAKEQLTRVLEVLPKTTQCNLIIYDHQVQRVWDELRSIDDRNREELLDRAKKIGVGGGTNIFDALERAFEDPSVDTIYLLTDGEPSAGRIVAPDDILDEVRRWNRQRQIVIHCIGLGIDSRLLKELAAQSGGSYRYVK
jgi:HEAT repeat protein